MSSSTELDNGMSTQEEPISSTSTSTTRRVHFPSDESQLRMISIAPEPFANQPLLSLGVILQRYRAACQRLQIRPLSSLLDQLSTMDDTRRVFDDRLSCLNIIHEKLDSKQMDAIEEILSRCRFYRLDFDSSIYDDLTLIQFFDVIEYYESCTHLNLSNHRSISAQGYQALTRYLRRTRFLERLDMNSVRFDDPSMFSFGRALRMASTLYELHLESCQLNGKMLQKFIQNLRASPTIRELYLCDNRLQVQDSLLINELIRSCGQFLRLLDLRSNSLQDGGISHIASQLSQYDEHHLQQNAISKISFQSNELTQQGIAFLAKCLLHNRTIHSLNLSYNNLTNEGFFLLRDALLTNRTINELILRNCRLTDQAAISLAEFIAESSTIQYLDLRENNIQASGICGIAIAMKMNQSLLKIDFDSIVPSGSNSTMTNIDRTKSNSSLLSLSNLRRMTVGIGNLTNSTSSMNNTSSINQELFEQKSKWMNDIQDICQRNVLLYEEYLQRQEEEQQHNRQTITNHHASQSTTNGIDVQLKESTVHNNNNNDDDDDADLLNSIQDVLQMIKTVVSTNEECGNESLDHNKLTDVTSINPLTKPSDENTIESLSNGNNEDLMSTTTTTTENDVPLSNSLFSLSDVNDDNNAMDDEEDRRRKLQHSDSLYLLRKKVQVDTDNIREDEDDDDEQSSA